MLVVMCLNPSYADEYVLDPTLTRIMKFAKEWDDKGLAGPRGLGGFIMLNAFSIVSTDPRALLAGNPNDRERLRDAQTDRHIAQAIADAGMIVVGWSTHLSHKRLTFRIAELKALIGDRTIYAWDINADGSPAHPLYKRRDTKPKIFELG